MATGKKRFFSFVLMLLLVLTSLPVFCHAETGVLPVFWEFSEKTNTLYIEVSEGSEKYSSARECPWNSLKEKTVHAYVVFTGDGMGDSTEECDIRYFFNGFTSLEDVRIAAEKIRIGEGAFCGAAALGHLFLDTEREVEIEEGAFCDQGSEIRRLRIETAGEEALLSLCGYDWAGEGVMIDGHVSEALSSETRAQGTRGPEKMMSATGADSVGMLSANGRKAPSGTNETYVGTCAYCGVTCIYGVNYEYFTKDLHSVRHWCSNCGDDQLGGVVSEEHVFSGSECIKCGYDSTCAHPSSHFVYDGCEWEEYCDVCGLMISSGDDHDFSEISYVYYSRFSNKEKKTCSRCGKSMENIASHVRETVYEKIDESTHYVKTICRLCDSTIITATESHALGVGDYEPKNGEVHARKVGCQLCEFHTEETEAHDLHSGEIMYYDADTHTRKMICGICGYECGLQADHGITSGTWRAKDAISHVREKSCSDCAWRGEDEDEHGFVFGEWSDAGDGYHERTRNCSVCGYADTEREEHEDRDSDGECDKCGHVMSFFSVTVPAVMYLSLSPDGHVFTSGSAYIHNSSTAEVTVKKVKLETCGGFSIVPYGSNLAREKVDCKLIGFSLNGIPTTVTRGESEIFDLEADGADEGWSILPGGDLPLGYDAKVSAFSEAYSGQVMTICFVIGWKN